MPVECDLHQPAAQVGNKRQADPVIRNLFTLPAVEFHGPDCTWRRRMGSALLSEQSRGDHNHSHKPLWSGLVHLKGLPVQREIRFGSSQDPEESITVFIRLPNLTSPFHSPQIVTAAAACPQ